MRWRDKTRKEKEAEAQRWRRVFAWFPVQMPCGTWVWLERYWERFVVNGDNGQLVLAFQYSLYAPEGSDHGVILTDDGGQQ